MRGDAVIFWNSAKNLRHKFLNVAITATLKRYAVDISNLEVSTMGRKVNTERLEEVLQTIRENDGQMRANDIAKELDLHPETVARLLAVADNESDELLTEDDQGFLGIFKWW